MPDYRIEYINRQAQLNNLAETFGSIDVLALDIETVDWWNRERERIALIQVAFRTGQEIKVAVIDALAKLNLKTLQPVLESPGTVKAIHNASFDAVKIRKHYGFEASPVFDTMLAARRSGEKKYSLQSQAHIHLNIFLDKGARQSDWSRRPLDLKQLDYAARDAYATLLLYENQAKRGLTGNYYIKGKSLQATLPLDNLLNSPEPLTTVRKSEVESKPFPSDESSMELSAVAYSILSIINKLPGHYGPEQLAVSVGAEQRVGLAGWIIDSAIGSDTDIDEETAKLIITDLCERGLVILTDSRRLATTGEGINFLVK